jgi:hypothetical protein
VNFSLDYYMNCYTARLALNPSSPLSPIKKTRAKSPQAVTANGLEDHVAAVEDRLLP